jgi:hypothetical protein
MSLLYRLCTEARFSAWRQQKQHGMRPAWGAADVLEHTYTRTCRHAGTLSYPHHASSWRAWLRNGAARVRLGMALK